MDKTNKTKDTRNDLANNSSTQTLPLLKILNHIGKNISKIITVFLYMTRKTDYNYLDININKQLKVKQL